MTGFFNMKPPLPRYSHIWDVNLVLRYLQTLSPVASLSLKNLTLKLTMLLALVSGQRCQTLRCLDLSHCTKKKEYIFYFDEVLKTSRKGVKAQEVHLMPYPPDRRLCIVTVLKQYISVTKELRQDTHLLVSYVKPHKRVSTDTVGRWLRQVMARAGVKDVYKAHSCRAAATSKAKTLVPMDIIMKAAGWANVNTFRKYYDKKVPENMGNAVLQM